MPSWIYQWKPFWIPGGESFKKAFFEKWIFVDGDSSDVQNVTDFPVLHSTDHTDSIRDDHPPTPRPSSSFTATTQMRLHSSTSTQSLSSACLELPFSNDEILSGYEEFDSSGTDLFTTWVKMSEHDILVQRMLIFMSYSRISRGVRKETCTSSHKNSSFFSTLLPVRLCRGDYSLDPDGEKKMPSRNNLQEGGISLPCKRRPTMSIMTF